MVLITEWLKGALLLNAAGVKAHADAALYVAIDLFNRVVYDSKQDRSMSM